MSLLALFSHYLPFLRPDEESNDVVFGIEGEDVIVVGMFWMRQIINFEGLEV
jgi:hypothetical protein